MWYRSLYWRIGFGFVALLALLLLTQALLYLAVTGTSAGSLPARSPERLASMVATDLSAALERTPTLDLGSYLREQYGHLFQPVLVVMADGRMAQNRDFPAPPGVRRPAGRAFRPGAPTAVLRLPDGSDPGGARPEGRQAGDPGAGEPPPPGRAAPNGSVRQEGRGWPEGRLGPERRGGPEGRLGPEGRPSARASIDVHGVTVGTVIVPTRPIQTVVILRELGPTMAAVGAVLLVVGAAAGSLVIFRPARRRMRALEQAASALGAGQTSVRAPEEGGDEVTALARSFNRMAAELEARAEAIKTSDRARRQLLADVSHELKTPLAAIRGYLETLLMPEVQLDEEARRRYLAIAGEETLKLESIVGDLLDLARLDSALASLSPQPVAIGRLFTRVADRHERLLREGRLRLETEIEPGLTSVWGDAGRLEQALQNIVANAVRHTPPGGRIVVSAASSESGVRLAVRDTGPGIPPDHLPRIFDRFYKADASRTDPDSQSGSGLGLSIVKAIVERHGGTVSVRNHPQGGAEFELELPGSPPPFEVATSAPPTAPSTD